MLLLILLKKLTHRYFPVFIIIFNLKFPVILIVCYPLPPRNWIWACTWRWGKYCWRNYGIRYNCQCEMFMSMMNIFQSYMHWIQIIRNYISLRDMYRDTRCQRLYTFDMYFLFRNYDYVVIDVCTRLLYYTRVKYNILHHYST